MSLKDLTVDQVRNEISQIIAQYPDRNGGLPNASEDYPEDKSCVYYIDQSGKAVTAFDDYCGDEAILVTPVCIVGQWVEDFHPELKQDAIFEGVLRRNALVGTIPATDTPINYEALLFLASVQRCQDDYGVTWGDIDLDACNAYTC